MFTNVTCTDFLWPAPSLILSATLGNRPVIVQIRPSGPGVWVPNVAERLAQAGFVDAVQRQTALDRWADLSCDPGTWGERGAAGARVVVHPAPAGGTPVVTYLLALRSQNDSNAQLRDFARRVRCAAAVLRGRVVNVVVGRDGRLHVLDWDTGPRVNGTPDALTMACHALFGKSRCREAMSPNISVFSPPVVHELVGHAQNGGGRCI
jgi:hypothetical protein